MTVETWERTDGRWSVTAFGKDERENRVLVTLMRLHGGDGAGFPTRELAEAAARKIALALRVDRLRTRIADRHTAMADAAGEGIPDEENPQCGETFFANATLKVGGVTVPKGPDGLGVRRLIAERETLNLEVELLREVLVNLVSRDATFVDDEVRLRGFGRQALAREAIADARAVLELGHSRRRVVLSGEQPVTGWIQRVRDRRAGHAPQ